MSDITLSAALRGALADIQQTTTLAQATAERLATGRAVNRASDDAAAFFRAQSLSGRAADLLAVKEGIDLGASAIGATLAGLDAIESLAGQLKGIAVAAQGADAATRSALSRQFDALRGQIGALAADAGFLGANLLAGQDLSIALDETGGASLTLSGAATDAGSLGIGTAAGDYNGFAAAADVNAAAAALDGAIAQLRSTAAGLASNASLLNARLEFTGNLVNTLERGAGTLIDADLDEEAARLLALRTAGELGAAGLRIAAESERAVLALV